MSNDTDTAPAAETEIAERAPLSDIFRNDTDRHEPEIQVGEQPQAAAPVAEAASAVVPSAQTAPTAETAAPAAPTAEEDKGPKWYREHLKTVSREREQERAELERLRRQPPPQTPASGRQLPDPAEDPAAYYAEIERRSEERYRTFELTQTLTISERFAKQQYGADVFEEAKAWLGTKPDIEAWAIQQPDPWTAAITQYQRERIAEEIGDDPKAYEQRLREKILAEIEAGRPASPAPAATPPTMRAPPPAPASTVRSAAPRDQQGRFAETRPLSATFKHRSGG